MFFYSWQPHQLQACALIADCKREVGTNFEDQAPLMYRSNRSFNIHHPGIWLFWKLLFKLPSTRAKMLFKCPTLGSIQVIKCPHPRDISQAHKWQKDSRNAFSCRTKSLYIQQIIRIQYYKNWEALLAYLLWTKVSCKAAEIAASRSLKAQSFFVCCATYKGFFTK